MPNALQLMQTILKSSFGMGARSNNAAFILVITKPLEEYYAGDFAMVSPDGTMSGPIRFSLSRDAAMKPARMVALGVASVTAERKTARRGLAKAPRDD